MLEAYGGMESTMVERVRGPLLAVLGAIVLLAFLGDARLWDRDEPRNAQAAHEMLERQDWIVPTFNGELRSHKPIMLYWLQMLSYSFFGQSEFTARLPSALLGVATVLAIALLASRLAAEPQWIGPAGFWSGATLATSLLFVLAGRAATPDSCLIAFSTIGIACLVYGLLKRPEERSPLSKTILEPRIHRGAWLAGYVALGCAVLSKGPVGVVLPLTVVHLWWLIVSSPERAPGMTGQPALTRALRRLWQVFHPLQCWRAIRCLRSLSGVALAILVAAPWYIAVGLATDGEFLREFFWEHNVGRAMTSMEGHRGSLLFYPGALLVGTFPWSLWLLPIVWWGLKAYRRGPASRTTVSLALVWAVLTVAAFSCASTKLPSYITSCYPGVALLVGGFLKDFSAGVRMPSRPWRTLASAIAVVLAVGIASGVIWVSKHEGFPMVRWASLSGVALASAGIASWIVDWNRRSQWVPAIWLSAAVMVHLGLFGIGSRAVDRYRTEVDMLVGQDDEDPATQWFGIGGIEPSWVYYLDRRIETLSPALESSLIDPVTSEQAWREVMQRSGARPGDRLIVEGADAVRLSQLVNQRGPEASGLRELGRTRRFLKSSDVVLFEFNPPEAASVAGTNSRSAINQR
jgi:4-amino-4-deoxy-L-arabinose transferase-like glycosyltransferase